MNNRIRELRKQKKITMKQLGEILGLAESTISQYETGKREPDISTLLRISEYFDVSVEYLLGYDDVTSQAISAAFKQKDYAAVERLAELPSGFISSFSEKGIAELEKLMFIKQDCSAGPTQKNITDDDIKFALFGGRGEITDEMYEEVKNFAAFVRQREEAKKKPPKD